MCRHRRRQSRRRSGPHGGEHRRHDSGVGPGSGHHHAGRVLYRSETGPRHRRRLAHPSEPGAHRRGPPHGARRRLGRGRRGREDQRRSVDRRLDRDRQLGRRCRGTSDPQHRRRSRRGRVHLRRRPHRGEHGDHRQPVGPGRAVVGSRLLVEGWRRRRPSPRQHVERHNAHRFRARSQPSRRRRERIGRGCDRWARRPRWSRVLRRPGDALGRPGRRDHGARRQPGGRRRRRHRGGPGRQRRGRRWHLRRRFGRSHRSRRVDHRVQPRRRRRHQRRR